MWCLLPASIQHHNCSQTFCKIWCNSNICYLILEIMIYTRQSKHCGSVGRQSRLQPVYKLLNKLGGQKDKQLSHILSSFKCVVLQMGGRSHQVRSGHLRQLQGSALVSNEGPRTPGAVSRESPVHAVQPIHRGEVPRLLGEHAHHTHFVPTATPAQGLFQISLGALTL
jgi:hypothetical protein